MDVVFEALPAPPLAAAPAEAHRPAFGDIVAAELARLARLWEEALDGGNGVF